MKNRITIAVILMLLIPAASWGIPVTVSFNLVEPFTDIDRSFSVLITADIPEPVMGWGIDIEYEDKYLGLKDTVVADVWGSQADFMGLAASLKEPVGDGDGLYALVFPLGISGKAVPLATLNFTVKDTGKTYLKGGYTLEDKNEGFLYQNALLGMAEVEFNNVFLDITPELEKGFALSSTPVPEPATFLLVGIGLLGAGILQTKRAGKLRLD